MGSNNEYEHQSTWNQGRGVTDLVYVIIRDRIEQEIIKYFNDVNDSK
jgi:hypothetical protein